MVISSDLKWSMAKRRSSKAKPSAATLREFALSLPETSEGISCNKAAFKAGAKNFFFLGEGEGSEEGAFNTMLKLTGSLAEAKKLARSQPGNYSVGGSGWLTARFASGEAPPAGLFDRWIEESYRALAPKKLVALLDG